MAKKKSSNDVNKNDAVSAVYKIDMHCAGCQHRILKCAKSIDGVASVKAEFEANKLNVFGKMDPLKVKTKLEKKMRKKVELISPQCNTKEKENNGNEKKTEERKLKELQLITVTLKLQLHCQGCIDKINKVLNRTKGVLDKVIEREKDQVMVKGTMDVKALVECLKDRLRRNVEANVEVVQPKKEGGNGNGNGKKGKKNGGNGDGDGAGDGGNRMVFMSVPGYGVVPISEHGFGYLPESQYVYGYPGYNGHLHAPQIFSDENPNACSIM